MARPYGKIKRPVKGARPPKKTGGEPFKIRLRGKDNAPLAMKDIQQGLLEAIRRLRRHDDLRAKWATLYISFIDEDGKEAVPDAQGEWEIYPYKCAAEEHGL